jgi:ubiquinone/menaquinone biosynthesis C-methylase UbiE
MAASSVPISELDLATILSCPIESDADGIISGMLAATDEVVRYEESFHDEQAAYYDGMYCDPEPIHTYIRRLIQRRVFAYCRNAPCVVDLCCGTGKGSIPLLELGMTVIGMDISREMLRVYRKKVQSPNLILVHADATNPPLRPGSCSAIQMIGGLHHVPDREACVRNSAEALAPGGHFMVHEPIQTGLSHWSLGMLRNLDAITNPLRMAQALGRRLGMYTPPVAIPDNRLVTTPYETPFRSPHEFERLLPPSMALVETRSAAHCTDWAFGKHLQPIKPLATAACLLDERIAKGTSWTGNAIWAVGRRQ